MEQYIDRPPTQQELLDEAALRSVYPFSQFDADHIDGTQVIDDFMLPDEEGDVITRAYRYELRDYGDVLRVQIPKNMARGTALRLMSKIIQWMETDDNI